MAVSTQLHWMRKREKQWRGRAVGLAHKETGESGFGGVVKEWEYGKIEKESVNMVMAATISGLDESQSQHSNCKRWGFDSISIDGLSRPCSLA
ncbi:hypothetical protein V6N13_108702 [Hibiscus sabdariffa]|uniref:Uncharacterized protein n=1 Tax=Hibiscus sabdariffa TaxID=183260 RepID=A0ABR2SSY9_9ROSI